jgi:flagellar operon protein
MGKQVYLPIQSQLNPAVPRQPQAHKNTHLASFSDHLQNAINNPAKLSISRHASERLQQRDIHITSDRWDQVESKVAEAKGMGIAESLVLLPEAALIVSVRNNTVITAMERKEANSQIFTNIDGTILMD